LIRTRSRVPELPSGLARWEKMLAHFTHITLYSLAIIVPLIGYARSSTFTQSDGVPFFLFMIPEILPKNDHISEILSELHEILAFTLLGVAIGVAGALALTRVLRSLLFDVSTTDPRFFAGAALLVAIVSLAATYIPARRALGVDATSVLRDA